MKILKYVFLLLLIFIVIGAIYLATLDGSYDVKRSRVVKAEPEVVFNELNDYKNWKDWGPWYEQDPSITTSYPENTVGEGGSYTWTSKEGPGRMNTIKVDKPKRIEQELIFDVPLFGEMKSDVYWDLEKDDEGTKLTWGMKGELGFLSRFMASGMEQQLGPMEERGMQLLDEHIQEEMKIFSIEPNGVVDYSGGHYLYLTTSCKINQVGSKYPVMMLKIATFLKSNNIRTTGSPFSLYHKYDEENGTTMFSVGFPVSERIVTPSESDILSGFMERGTYYKTTLKGSYENSDKAWETAMKNAEELDGYRMIQDGEPFELYINSPVDTPNPSKLITEIYIPVEKIKVPLPPQPVQEEVE